MAAVQASIDSDVLNKLAAMGDESDRRTMLRRLFVFMQQNGTPIVSVPTISKLTVDLYKLYYVVRELGGMVEVVLEFIHNISWFQHGRRMRSLF